MTPERLRPFNLPEAVRGTLDDLGRHLRLHLEVWSADPEGHRTRVHPAADDPEPATVPTSAGPVATAALGSRDGHQLELWARSVDGAEVDGRVELVGDTVRRVLDLAHEIRFFTYELYERYEEINLLYSISEKLGSGAILRLHEVARAILDEVSDVLGARRASLWVPRAGRRLLDLVAEVGASGLQGPVDVGDPESLTAAVFREGRPRITGWAAIKPEAVPGVRVAEEDSILSVPIRYTPPEEEARTVGVINLIGRRRGGPFTASDQKLLSAIGSQVGAALENNRLIHQSLARERMAHEMELAHHLQMKLLPEVDRFEGVDVAARVEPAEMVGGDFYQVFQLSEERLGVMIGDVSTHGFPAALIMALSMSAATVYASELRAPADVLRHLDDQLRDELETTEMFLSLFYCVLDRRAHTLTYANAGHPHAFLIGRDGTADRLAATDPPVGIAGPEAYGEAVHPWDPGADLLLLFTDGLSDTLTTQEVRNGEAFVVQTVVEQRARTPGEIVDVLFARAREARPSIPSDDRTALILTGR